MDVNKIKKYFFKHFKIFFKHFFLIWNAVLFQNPTAPFRMNLYVKASAQ